MWHLKVHASFTDILIYFLKLHFNYNWKDPYKILTKLDANFYDVKETPEIKYMTPKFELIGNKR